MEERGRSGAEMSVAEAAEAAGLSRSRVNALVRSGRLPARRIGNQDVILDPSALLSMPRRPGRPMSARIAWGLLLLADGERPDWLSPGDVYRLRKHLDRLRHDPAPELLLQALVVKRAERLPLHGPAPRRLLEDADVVPSGISDPRAGLSAGSDVEAYVHADDLRSVVRRHLLVEPQGGRPNVWLHSSAFVPPSSVRLQVAADLAEHGGSRERSRSRELIRAGMEGVE